MDFLEVSTGFPSQQDAAYVARSVIHTRLAVAARVEGPVLSMGWRDGTLVEAEEWRLLLTVQAERFDQLAAYIIRRHPRPDPQVVAVPLRRHVGVEAAEPAPSGGVPL
ncbi:hypothetical protein GCM10009827_075140 [Dactylosporangium maewongense]|uniref:Uncharacterized protein n=1 Tax=Dactylosporangium maewongense TaxID=634393 RepID=A0ABN2BN39_9ACTN